MAVTLRLLEKEAEKLSKEKFVEHFGTLTEGIAIENSVYAKGYYGVYMLRRMAYAVILVFAYALPTPQLFLCLIVAIIPVFSSYSHR
jgi:hypothetical protein